MPAIFRTIPATARVDPMLKLNAPLALGAALAMVLPAAAADYIPEPPVIEYKEPAPAYGGWYLRGHIGMSNQRLGSLTNPNYSRAAVPLWDAGAAISRTTVRGAA